MNVQLEVLTVTPTGPIKPGQVVSIGVSPFKIEDENSFVFARGELNGSKSTTSVTQAFFSYPNRFECQIPMNYPETPEQGDQARLELAFTDNVNFYTLQTNVTIVNASSSSKGVMLKCAPTNIELPAIARTNFAVSGMQIDDLSDFYLQKTSGSGPARVMTNIIVQSDNIVRFKINPSAISQLEADSRFKVFATSTSTRQLVSCPTPIILEDPALTKGDASERENPM